MIHHAPLLNVINVCKPFLLKCWSMTISSSNCYVLGRICVMSSFSLLYQSNSNKRLVSMESYWLVISHRLSSLQINFLYTFELTFWHSFSMLIKCYVYRVTMPNLNAECGTIIYSDSERATRSLVYSLNMKILLWFITINAPERLSKRFASFAKK